MTDSRRSSYSQPDPPLNEALLRQTMASYQRGLAELATQPGGMERLNALLLEVSSAIEKQSREVISETLLAYQAKADQPVTRSTRAAARYQDRPGQPTARSPQPAPWELLSASKRQGPRLAQKLILAEARRNR